MDNETNLSKEQIKNLVSDFKDGKSAPEDLMKKHLSDGQRQQIISALKNPDMLKQILSSQKAKDIMKALKGDNNEP